jgi:adenylate cyclase
MSIERPVAERQMLGLLEWLSGSECLDDEAKLIGACLDDEATLIVGLGERLRALPLPVDCIALYLRTLHPEFRARIIVWSPNAPIKIYDREHTTQHIAAFAGSPIREVMETGEWQTVRADTEAQVFNQLEIFRDLRIAELLVAPLPNGAGVVSAVSFGTSLARGYTIAERRTFKRILPTLCGACELRVLRRTVATLLNTYVGQATGQRILAGHVRRGDAESLEAALLLCDLHDFTGLSNRLPAAQVLEHLNFYFDQVVPAITANGGEVLKFIGDAVLAFFQSEKEPAANCAAAFIAANRIHARLADVSTDTDIVSAGIALHHGEVSYGNIGSGLRLDFTVIGRDVNLVSRIQGLCGATGHSLLMSARFNALLGGESCHSIGRYAVKGFAEPVELFSTAPENSSLPTSPSPTEA